MSTLRDPSKEDKRPRRRRRRHRRRNRPPADPRDTNRVPAAWLHPRHGIVPQVADLLDADDGLARHERAAVQRVADIISRGERPTMRQARMIEDLHLRLEVFREVEEDRQAEMPPIEIVKEEAAVMAELADVALPSRLHGFARAMAAKMRRGETLTTGQMQFLHTIFRERLGRLGEREEVA